MARKWRNVAEFALIKSNVYRYFLDKPLNQGLLLAKDGGRNETDSDLRKRCPATLEPKCMFLTY